MLIHTQETYLEVNAAAYVPRVCLTQQQSAHFAKPEVKEKNKPNNNDNKQIEILLNLLRVHPEKTK